MKLIVPVLGVSAAVGLGVALYRRSKSTPVRSSSAAPRAVDLQRVVGLPLGDGAVTQDQALVAAGLLNGFSGGVLTSAEQLMLLAFAWHESRLNPAAVGHVDAKWGNSYTVFQLRRDVELRNATQALGLSDTDVIPPVGTRGQALVPYLINQARVAEWLAKQKGVLKMRAAAAGNDEREMLDLAASWAGLRSWQYILDSSIAGPVLRGRIPTDAEIPAINAQLRARKSQAMGTLNRLVTYRAFKRAILGA